MRRAAILLAVAAVGACATGSGSDASTTRRDAGDSSAVDAAPGDAIASDAAADATTDAVVDGGAACMGDEVGTCTTSCGSTGTQDCIAGAFGPCVAPAEDCNGVDDDCDAVTDEIGARMCSSTCGGGSETCLGGSWSGCSAAMPVPETCNGIDDDCDSSVDEGLSRACSTACGSGTETCSAGTFVGCTAARPSPETCDGVDQDCDGSTDESLTRSCTSACGSGTETCTSGAYAGCSAPMPAAESCNEVDDDCDGTTDEGFFATVFDPVPIAELTAEQPTCDGPDARLDVCMSGASRWCMGHGSACYVGGAGHLTATASNARIVCFTREATRLTATRAEIAGTSSITLTDANIREAVAQSAINRHCRSLGHEAGVGPVEHSTPNVIMMCLPSTMATYRSIATSELTSRGCDPVGANPSALVCSTASDAYCRANGFNAGFGPVEWNGTNSAVVCFD